MPFPAHSLGADGYRDRAQTLQSSPALPDWLRLLLASLLSLSTTAQVAGPEGRVRAGSAAQALSSCFFLLKATSGAAGRQECPLTHREPKSLLTQPLLPLQALFLDESFTYGFDKIR